MQAVREASDTPEAQQGTLFMVNVQIDPKRQLIGIDCRVGVPATAGEVPTLADLQEMVGGYITTGFRLASPIPGRMIDAYCNDEGLMEPVVVLIQYSYMGEPVAELAGSVVLCASDEAGDTHLLAPEELAALEKHFSWEMTDLRMAEGPAVFREVTKPTPYQH